MNKKFKDFCTLLFLAASMSLVADAAYSQSPLDSLNCTTLDCIFEKISDPDKATSLFNHSLGALEKRTPGTEMRLRQLQTDILDIAFKDELKHYQTLKSVREKATFFKQFWLNRDLTLATRTNERLVEHYTRLRFVRTRYSSPVRRGYDDRGIIYIKYGPADDTVIDIVPRIDFRFDDLGRMGAELSRPLESWAYRTTAGTMTFDFIEKGALYSLATDIGEAVLDTRPERLSKILIGLARRRAPLSPNYAALHAALLATKDGADYELHRVLGHYRSDNLHVKVNSPKVITDIFEETQNLPFAGQWLAFRDDPPYRHLAVVYGIQPSELKGVDKKKNLRLVLKSALRDSNRTLAVSQIDTVFWDSDKIVASEPFIGTIQYLVPGRSRHIIGLEMSETTQGLRGIQNFAIASDMPSQNSLS